MKIAAGPAIGILSAALMLSACQSADFGRRTASVQPGLVSADTGLALGYFDRTKALRAEYQALEFGATGAPVDWNGRGDRRGSVIAGPAYQIGSTACRDYAHTVFIAGEAVVSRGTACRLADGKWRLSAPRSKPRTI